MSKYAVVKILEQVLGTGTKKSKDNVAFHCPFCNHHKKKLEVNIVSQYWNCWVCNTKGRKIPVLLRKLNAQRELISRMVKLLDDVEFKPKKTTTGTDVVRLPPEFKPLWVLDKKSPEYRNAVYYLKTRNIGIHDIMRYRIGYCTEGRYSGKIIIPSYDANGSLNYFQSRAYYKDDQMTYINPPCSKDVVGFELFINWNLPVVLVEGAMDAIAIKRNAIPLFGKTISNTLKLRIVENGVKELYICLDEDAKREALKVAKYFLSNGIKVRFVWLTESDPSALGFEKMIGILNDTELLTEENLLEQQILCEL